MVTDDDCRWESKAADAAQEVGPMQAKGALARAMVRNFDAAFPATREPSPIVHALEDAVIPTPSEHDPELMAMLGAATSL